MCSLFLSFQYFKLFLKFCNFFSVFKSDSVSLGPRFVSILYLLLSISSIVSIVTIDANQFVLFKRSSWMMCFVCVCVCGKHFLRKLECSSLSKAGWIFLLFGLSVKDAFI